MKSTVANKTMKAFGLLLLCAAIAGCSKSEAPAAASQTPAPAADTAQSVPATPANVIVWAPPGKEAPADFAKRMRSLQADGVATQVRVIKEYDHEVKEGYGPGFNEMAIIEFPNEASYESWKSGAGSELGPDLITSRVDVATERKSRKNSPDDAIYVVGHYETLVPFEDYKIYSQDYIDPNMDNQYHSGIMTRYTMYVEREATGELKNPRALLVQEYANQAEFDRKKSVKDPYKALMLSGTHPEWARLNTEKKKLRRDFAESYAKPVF
jgi:hypothetical protein